MSCKFILWMAALLAITVLIELCGFLFGSMDFDPGEERQGGTDAKD